MLLFMNGICDQQVLLPSLTVLDFAGGNIALAGAAALAAVLQRGPTFISGPIQSLKNRFGGTPEGITIRLLYQNHELHLLSCVYYWNEI